LIKAKRSKALKKLFQEDQQLGARRAMQARSRATITILVTPDHPCPISRNNLLLNINQNRLTNLLVTAWTKSTCHCLTTRKVANLRTTLQEIFTHWILKVSTTVNLEQI